MTDLPNLVSVGMAATGLATGLVAIFRAGPDRRKVAAEADKIDVDGAVVVSTAALAQMHAAITRAEAMQSRVDDLESRVDQLENDLHTAQALLRSALAFIERLLNYIADHVPVRTDAPTIPTDLHDHISTQAREDWRTP